ncbi:hypothetical protein KKH43_03315 [Patescibacteria group bacterium]|nr:hypothetical protein [Patescibacteria group bacterium]
MSTFKRDPLKPLLECTNDAVLFFVKRDVLGEKRKSVKALYDLPDPKKILRRQKRNGRWKYPAAKKDIRTQHNYDFLETHRQLRFLVERYGFNKKHDAIKKAAQFIFSFQTSEGDFRGIYGTQHSPNFTAAVTELLIKAGYQNDQHIEKVMKWLIDYRLNDGGWAIALRTRGDSSLEAIMNPKAKTIELDKTKTFSHLITGMVLRAFAAHPRYRKSVEAHKAGILLKSRFFKKDVYTDRKSEQYWTKIQFPYLWTDILSSLYVLERCGFSKDDPDIQKVLQWFVDNQQKSGLWKAAYKTRKDADADFWVTMEASRVFKRWGVMA